VALETETADLIRAKQILIIAAVRLVTSATAQPESRLVQEFLLGLLGLFAMAAKAGIDCVRFGQSWRPACMWIVTIHAIAGRARMLHLCVFDLIRCFCVASKAELFRGILL
jgi:hypothetical protein